MTANPRHAAAFQAVREAVLGPSGHTAIDLRTAIHDRARACATHDELPDPDPRLASLDALVQKITRNAYKVIDDDLQELQDAGRSQDEVFEIVISTALGAAAARFDAGMAALHALQEEAEGGAS